MKRLWMASLQALMFACLLPLPAAAQQQAAAVQAVPAPVNLNTASVEQLTSLPGIGERTAQRIVEFRQKNGPFKRAEDLMNVQGIGEKSFLKLKPLVVVTPPKADRPSS